MRMRTFWINEYNDSMGSRLAQIIEDNDLVILNNNILTLLLSPNHRRSVIDLASPCLAALCSLLISGDTGRSDHFMVELTLSLNETPDSCTKLNLTVDNLLGHWI